MVKAHPNSATSSDDTKARIVQATLATIRIEGIIGTSARAIARTGGFNQALIFYHFGSIDNVVVAAVSELGARRNKKYQAELEQVTSLPELVSMARSLHADDTTGENMTVLAQTFAGASRSNGDNEMGKKLSAELAPWSQLLAATIKRVLGDSPIAAHVPHELIADAMSALFLGIELLDDLDPNRGHAESMFDSLEAVANLLDPFLR